MANVKFMQPPEKVGVEDGTTVGEAEVDGKEDDDGEPLGSREVVGRLDGIHESVGRGEIVGGGKQVGTSQYAHSIFGSVVKHQARSYPRILGLRQKLLSRPSSRRHSSSGR
mmetsp:Transcript_30877/g.74609  ORF Transcript_30877/g.74609 Transcript_30877/m.74609 type:complete len:111 (-) Transcript_30877:112-444(-)